MKELPMNITLSNDNPVALLVINIKGDEITVKVDASKSKPKKREIGAQTDSSITYRQVTYPTGVKLKEQAEKIVPESTIGYDRCFVAKLSQLSDNSKMYYSRLKNLLLSYQGKPRISWKGETFKFGKSSTVQLTVRGKTLCVILSEKLKNCLEESGEIAIGEFSLPYKIKNEKHAVTMEKILRKTMTDAGYEKTSFYVEQDFYLPYRSLSTLIQDGLVRPDHELRIWQKQ